MPTTSVTGSTDATRISRWSSCGSYRGVHGCSAVAGGPAPYAAFFGGRTQTAGVPSPINLPTIFRVTSTATLADGSKQASYNWRRVTDVSVPNHLEHAAAVGCTSAAHVGRIIISGGHNDWADAVANTTLFGWAILPSETWTVTASGAMTVARACHTLTVLNDSKILAVGGYTSWNTAVATAERWDPASGTWTGTGGMTEPRLEHAAVKLADGRVLVTGGRRPFIPFATGTGTLALWHLDETGGGTATDAQGGLNLTTAGATQGVYAKGGRALRMGFPPSAASLGAPQTAMNTALLGEWTFECWMSAAVGTVACNGMTGVGDVNNVTMCVGISAANKFFIYWRQAGGTSTTMTSTADYTTVMPVAHSLTRPRMYHLAVVKALAASGTAGLYDVFLYVNGTLMQTWTDQVNAAGGSAGYFQLGADVRATYPASTGIVDEVRISSVVRSASDVAMSYLTQCGQVNWDDPTPANRHPQGFVSSSAEIYDPTAGTWTRTGSMGYARYGHALVLLSSGLVLAVGGAGHPVGQGSPAALATAELWDPATGRWQAAGAMSVARELPAATTLPNGLVAVVGGEATTEDLYDPAAGLWRRSPAALGRARHGARAAFVGGVWVLGGGAELSSGAWATTEFSHILVPGAEAVADGAGNGQVTITTAPTSTTFTYQTVRNAAGGLRAGAAATATPLAAAGWGAPVGPYLYDDDTPSVTAKASTVSARLDAGRGHRSVTVASTANFPDAPGYLAFSVGKSRQIFPVPYLGLISGTELRLDASFVFPQSVSPGDSVVLLTGKAAATAPTGAYGAFFLTASPAGLGAAVRLIKEITAGGIPLDLDISYPGDRGLGGEGYPTFGLGRLSSAVTVWADDPIDSFITAAQEDT